MGVHGGFMSVLWIFYRCFSVSCFLNGCRILVLVWFFVDLGDRGRETTERASSTAGRPPQNPGEQRSKRGNQQPEGREGDGRPKGKSGRGKPRKMQQNLSHGDSIAAIPSWAGPPTQVAPPSIQSRPDSPTHGTTHCPCPPTSHFANRCYLEIENFKVQFFGFDDVQTYVSPLC